MSTPAHTHLHTYLSSDGVSEILTAREGKWGEMEKNGGKWGEMEGNAGKRLKTSKKRNPKHEYNIH